MRRNPIPVGAEFGRLVVQGVARHDPSRGNYFLLCVCVCGKQAIVREDCLKSGNTRSCGCLHKEAIKANKKHGMHQSRTYRIWCGMKGRCNPSSRDRKRHLYAGKGIRVCERWKSFEAFLADMGEAPQGMSIERKDGNGDYCPGNCVWATPKQQANNTTKNVFIEHGGMRLTVTQWAELIGVKANTLTYRLRRGWTISRALTLEALKA